MMMMMVMMMSLMFLMSVSCLGPFVMSGQERCAS